MDNLNKIIAEKIARVVRSKLIKNTKLALYFHVEEDVKITGHSRYLRKPRPLLKGGRMYVTNYLFCVVENGNDLLVEGIEHYLNHFGDVGYFVLGWFNYDSSNEDLINFDKDGNPNTVIKPVVF